MSTKLKAGTATSGAVLDADTAGILEFQSGSTPTTALTIDTSQNVGIGRVPDQRLQIASPTAVEYDMFVGSTRTLTLYADATQTIIAAPTAIPMIFRTSDTERMRIESSGNVLIGNSTAVGTSTVYCYRSDANYNFTANNTNAGTQSFFAFRYNGSGVGSISGNNSNVTYSTSSDYRLKENIAPMTGALNKVSELKPCTYTWKVDGSEGQGFIAHELAEVVPECVTGEKDAVETIDELDAEGKVIGTKEIPKYQGIDTSFLVATLTAAIQELNAKVDAQALEIQALKGAA